MSHKEIAQLWLIGLAGIAIIVWYHGNSTQRILSAIGYTGQKPPDVIPGPAVNLGTNRPIPQAGNEFGYLATYGKPLSGNVQPQGPDTAFKDIFFNLTDGE